jgi:hypothetical protein
MKFQEYVLMRDQQIDEAGWGSALNGLVSGIGRTPIQAARGIGNTAYGAAQTGVGAVQTTAGVGKGIFGGGWGTAGRGLKNMALGSGRALSGLGQTAAAGTGATLIGRGMYAGRGNNTAQPGAWGGFKNWMGWQGKAQPGQAVNPVQQGQPQQQTTPQQGQPQQQTTPQQGQMTPQQAAFFQSNPGFNQQGLASSPMQQQVVTPPQNGQNNYTSNYLDDLEASQGWNQNGGKTPQSMAPAASSMGQPQSNSQQSWSPQQNSGQMTPDIQGVLANVPSLNQAIKSGQWNGQSPLQPFQINRAIQELNRFRQGADPTHAALLQKTINHLMASQRQSV